jgi:hypothetical protein
MFAWRYYDDTLRVYLLCIVSAVVRSQTCANVVAVYVVGMCDGTNILMNKCTPAGTAGTTPLNDSRFTAASCQSDTSAFCIALEGSFNPDYCEMSSEIVPFCRNLAVSTRVGLCTFDSDCKTIVLKLCPSSSPGPNSSVAPCVTSNVTLATRIHIHLMCCVDIKTVATQGCTGVDMSRLDLLLDIMRDAKQCEVYPNCTRAAAQVLTSAATRSVCTGTLPGVVLLLYSFVLMAVFVLYKSLSKKGYVQ